MAATTAYGFNIVDESGTGAGPYHVDVFKNPAQVVATPTAPSVTTGPLGSSGTVSVKNTSGAGTQVGFSNLLNAISRAMIYVANDKVLNNT